jgi:hypothetical protein
MVAQLGKPFDVQAVQSPIQRCSLEFGILVKRTGLLLMAIQMEVNRIHPLAACASMENVV